jgi:hypothetical protein
MTRSGPTAWRPLVRADKRGEGPGSELGYGHLRPLVHVQTIAGEREGTPMTAIIDHQSTTYVSSMEMSKQPALVARCSAVPSIRHATVPQLPRCAAFTCPTSRSGQDFHSTRMPRRRPKSSSICRTTATKDSITCVSRGAYAVQSRKLVGQIVNSRDRSLIVTGHRHVTFPGSFPRFSWRGHLAAGIS